VVEAKELEAEVERLADLGKYDEAIPLAQRALALWEKALGPDHPRVARSLDLLGLQYLGKRDHAHAEPLFQRALTVWEKAPGRERSNAAIALDDLARLYENQADYARAEIFYQRALALRETALGSDHPKIVDTLKRLANVYKFKGDYARAEPLYRRALAIMEKALDPYEVANLLNALAELSRTRGDYASAEALLQRSVATLEKTPDHSDSDLAPALGSLGELHRIRGDLAGAEPLLRRAISLWEKAVGSDHPKVAHPLSSLAVLYYDRGDYASAESLHQRALAIREKALGSDHPDVASSLNNLGEVYRAHGDDGRAEPLLQRALTIRKKALGPDHPDVAGSLDNLAKLYVERGRVPLAVSAAQQAADIQDRHTAAVLATGSEELKRLYTDKLVDGTHWDISLHVQHAPADLDAARLALTVLLRRKGRVLDSMTDSLAALRGSLAPDDRQLLDRLASIYGQLSAQVSRGPGKAPPEEYRRTLAALAEERRAVETDIGRRSAAFHTEQTLVTLSEVEAAIPSGAALVEIARYTPYQRHPSRPTPSGAPRYVAYVLHPSGAPTFADLGEAAPLEAAVDAFRRALADPDLTHDPKPAASALDRLLMAPIRPLLGDARWVFLSPDGPLNLVPFAALVDEQGHYLVERYLFSYLTSGRDLLRFEDRPPPPREAPLIVANPAFDDADVPPAPEASRRDVRSIDMVTHALPSLGSTAEEARHIARLFPGSRVLMGAQATEQAIEAAHGPRLLHLATHGFFLPALPVPEALLHGPGTEPTAAERAALLQRESPLLRSGVALAGFNRRKVGSDAGVLTALEAAGLDLHGTRLVVLSTCESGLGEASVGEGVYGMRRALTMAGAETQVMSLWQVDTGRTRERMEAYYQRLKDGAGRSEAMRDVELAMLADKKTAHPNLWASFIVSGEWRTLDGAPRLPEVGRVAPGARGCACGSASGEPRWPGGLAAALGLIALRRRLSRTGARRRGA
jgi:CHAT domain-containing protein